MRTGAVVRTVVVMVLAAVAISAGAPVAGAQDAGAQAATSAQDAGTPAAAQESGGGLRGLVPRVRLFCGPCFDGYAQEVWVRSLRWEQTAPEDGWTRRRGAMFVPPVPAELSAPAGPGGAAQSGTAAPSERPADPERAPTLLINEAVFDPATVYVRHGDEWVNVAITLGLPGRRALPTLPPYIQVQQAPIPEEPRGEWGR